MYYTLQRRTTAMTKAGIRERIVLHPEPGSFTAEGDSSSWSDRDLDPVSQANKKWEWFHVGGFWTAARFKVAQLDTPSSAVVLGLNPGLALIACVVGNLLVPIPTCSSGYIGSKYGLNFSVSPSTNTQHAAY